MADFRATALARALPAACRACPRLACHYPRRSVVRSPVSGVRSPVSGVGMNVRWHGVCHVWMTFVKVEETIVSGACQKKNAGEVKDFLKCLRSRADGRLRRQAVWRIHHSFVILGAVPPS